jgi:hypothetical protein
MDAKVRVWTEGGVTPEVLEAKDRWHDRGLELVANRDLPALIVHGKDRNLDLALRLSAAPAAGLPVLVCDRALIQAKVDEEGNHEYRAYYLVQKLQGDELAIEIPAAAEKLQITINGLVIQPKMEAGDWNLALARVHIDPKIFRADPRGKKPMQDMVLYVEYRVPAEFAEGDSRWQTLMTGPIIRGEVFLGQVRWLVTLPPTWISVVTGGAQPAYSLSFTRYLPCPVANIPESELDDWPTGRDALKISPGVSQTFLLRSQQPFSIVHLPIMTWLGLCSMLFLVMGLVLFLAPLPRPVFWGLLVGLTAALLVGGFVWTAWVPALLFGIQLGVFVLVLFLVVQWVRRERYRRQVIFMPGFTRLKPGSSLVHAAPRPREASTVDAPAQVAGGPAPEHPSGT